MSTGYIKDGKYIQTAGMGFAGTLFPVPDWDNVIKDKFSHNAKSSPDTYTPVYTATEDCFIRVLYDLHTSMTMVCSLDGGATIISSFLVGLLSGNYAAMYDVFPMKKGQVLSVREDAVGDIYHFWVYGVK